MLLMKNLHLTILLLGVLLSAPGCKKQETYQGPQTLTGQVIDKTTGEGVEYPYVYLVGEKGWFDNSDTLIAQVVGEKNGTFTFSFDWGGYLYYVKAIKDGYYNDGNNRASVDKPSQFVQVPLQPEGYIKLRIKNAPPTDQYDQFWISNVFGYSMGPFNGENIDTTVKGRAFGNATRKIYTTIIIGRQDTMKKEYSIFCPAHDTTHFEILY